MPRFAHGDAEGFRLIGARDHAAVVVGEDHERHAAQFRLKHALAAGIEIVAVHERDRGRHGYNMRIDRVMTPQISKARSSVMSIGEKAGFSGSKVMTSPRRR